jgi:hypothetical protein
MTVSTLRKYQPAARDDAPPDYTGLNANPPVTVSRRLAHLTAEHDDLDLAISALLANGSCDDLVITRLKKRKLQLKDEIAAVRG